MAFTEIRTGEWIARAVNIYKDNFILLVATHFVAVMLSVVTLGILAGPMMAGLFLITIALVDGDEPVPQVGDLFHGFSYIVQPFLFVVVWWGLVLGITSGVIGTLLQHSPFIQFIANFVVLGALQTLGFFGIPLIVGGGMDALSALGQSVNTTRQQFGQFFLLAMAASIVSSLGGVFFILGVFLTLPIHTCVVCIAYREVFADLKATATLNTTRS